MELIDERCYVCGHDKVEVLSHDKEQRTGVLVTVKCIKCASEWQTVIGKPKDEQAKDHDEELKDILDTVGDN